MRQTVDTIGKAMRDFNRFLVGCMDEQNLTQTQVAERMGISHQLFSYKKKNNAWTFEDYLRLTEILGEQWRML